MTDAYRAADDGYDAVVYDLDGTLVRLDVDWTAAELDVRSALEAAGVPVDDRDLWDLLDAGHEEGFATTVEEVLADHERRGARAAELLPAAAELPRPVPVGVCSLNAESAVRLALERHDLDPHVDAVVGRDSVDAYKPDPDALLAAVRALSADPARTLFVGDTERDAVTAERAGVDFRFVESG